MKHRRGATLLEVLVAIFVMAIGMIALLTLFPVGALRMAQSIQDDLCAQAADNAHNMSIIHNVRQDAKLPNLFATPGGGFAPGDPNQPSYPVFVDPLGERSATGLSKLFVGGLAGPGGMPRVRPSFLPAIFLPNARIEELRWFSLIDSLAFTDTGDADLSAVAISREIRYSYGMVLQRPRLGDSQVVDATVIVYNRRPIGVQPTEVVYGAGFDGTNNVINLNYAGTPPNLRSGDWLLDSTYIPLNGGANGTSHAFFYRVVSADDDGLGNITIEVEQPIRYFGRALPATFNAVTKQFLGSVVVLDGVADVFEKGPMLRE